MISDQFDITENRGLTNQEARARLAKEGYNELPTSKKRNFFHIMFEIIREPMFILLIACGLIYLIVGDIEEALMLLGFVFVIIGITIYQERKTEKALEALRNLSSPRALVIRDGEKQRISGREVVRDDVILLSEGDRVPADAVLISTSHLSVDESLLTGESVPVRKKVWDGKSVMERPGGDDLPFVYSGTMVVKGHAIGQVQYIGSRTEIGKIGKSLQTLEQEDTDLQRQTNHIIKTFALIGGCLFVILVVVFGLTRHDWLHGLIAGLTLAMATLPEEFPVVLTIFLALGAWRISQRKVLTRRVPAVEMLGAATVLCVDKTGTLTMNHMTVSNICVNGKFFSVGNEQTSLPENLHEIVEWSILASPADPFDPMEKAMKELGVRTLFNTEHLHEDWKLMREYPLSENLLAMSRVWQSKTGKGFVIAAKGAPEAIADLCHLEKNRLAELHNQITKMADRGLRVIGVARANFPTTTLPGEQHDFKFTFLGLFGLTDPVRSGVPEAVQECYSAGIRVIMITGDYPGTAQNIAEQIGLKPANQVIIGAELDRMSDEQLKERIRTTSIFARVVPEQKLRIVNALKKNNEVVAMTGDGVNDAPALKSAHIGIAMGGRGTDVARESSALVLLDDNFASIVAAVRMGRRIFDNLKNAINYIYAVHIPIAGMSLIPVLLKWPLVLWPVHIVFLELIIDPACSVVFEMEDEEKDIMRRKPRRLEEPLFNRQMIFNGLVQGLAVLLIVVGIYIFATRIGLSTDEARTFAFINLVIGNLGLILTNRSRTRPIYSTLLVRNKALVWAITGTLAVLIMTLTIPFLRVLFKFTAIDPLEGLLCLSTALLAILISESVKIPFIQKIFANNSH